MKNILLELTRRCNNSRIIRKIWGDNAAVFFWNLYKKYYPKDYEQMK